MSIQQMLLGASGASGYLMDKSLRFRASASAYLNRTPATTSDQKTFTLSTWIKRGTLNSSGNIGIAVAGTGAAEQNRFMFVNDTLWFDRITGGGVAWNLQTTQVFRDPSAWYHIVLAVDTTQATAANRVKFYVNGNQITAFTTANYPALNDTLFYNASAVTHRIGLGDLTPLYYFDGYFADTYFIDGQALTPASFGETNALTGVWQPKAYAGGSYGTNGFYLDFEDTSSVAALGTDKSGNGNTWTVNNISLTSGVTYDSMTDVPTLTNATTANYAVLNPLNPARSTLTNGNLTASGTTDLPSIIPESGTWYFEINGVSKTWTPPAAFPAAAGDYNFGQRPFANTPTNQTLNTFNLPTATILKGNTVMDATLYTGNGGTLAVTNAAGFKPDLVWIKQRNVARDNQLQDSVRGVSLSLQSNTTSAESNFGLISSINSNGFTVFTNGTYLASNENGGSYVAWQWQAGQGTTSSNTAGSITSTVSVNASAGFSVVTLTTQPSGVGTFGHGLGVAPSLVITKFRSSANNWIAYHSSVGNTSYLLLDTTTAATVNSSIWNNTSPTSSIVTLGSSFSGSNPLVAYCWSEIDGFSKFGSYTGNGSADGPFVYTGFRPAFVMMKRTDSTSNWFIHDTRRDPYNLSQSNLYAESSSAEDTLAAGNMDILSNGFKSRTSGGSNPNVSGGTYIYMAFAENPFKNSLAR